MAHPSSQLLSPLARLLSKVRELSEQVRASAERVHQETQEAHRLAEIARDQLHRGQELSRASHREAHQVHGTIEQSLDNSGKTERLRPADDN
jgi:methyl-accepting chemotaxis protein